MQLHLQNISLPLSLGVHEWEKLKPRRVRLNLWVEYDATLAMETDGFAHALDYAALEKAVVEAAEDRHYELVEALVAAVARAALAFPRVSEVIVEAEKPGVMQYAETIRVREVFRR